MSQLVIDNLAVLEVLTKASAKSAAAILKDSKAFPGAVKAIVEVVINFREESFPLPPGYNQKIAVYDRQLNVLADKKLSHQRKLTLLLKYNKLIPLLLVPAVKFLKSNVSS